MTDADRAKLDEIIQLLQGFKVETTGVRRHVSSVADYTEQVLKDVLRTVQDIRDRNK